MYTLPTDTVIAFKYTTLVTINAEGGAIIPLIKQSKRLVNYDSQIVCQRPVHSRRAEMLFCALLAQLQQLQ